MPLFKAISGSSGKSAYEIAVDNGFVGTESQWLASINGAIAIVEHESSFNHGHFDEAYNHSESPHLGFEGLNKLIVSDHVPDDLQEGDVVINFANQ